MKLGVYGPLTSEAMKTYRRLGVGEVFFNVEEATRSSVEQAKSEGFKVYACVWAFKAASEALGVKNVYGKKGVWIGAGCPNNPSVKENCFEAARNALLNFEVDGIVLDGVRFPSPGSGKAAFLTCFCEHCREKAGQLGYDLSEVKRTLMAVNDPALFVKASSVYPKGSDLNEWLRFRCHSIAETVKDVKTTLVEVDPNAKLGAAVFAPSIAPLVGQDYTNLSPYLDFIQPMIYHRGDGVACINFELAKLVKEYSESELEEGRSLTSIYKELGFNGPLTSKSLLENGLPIETVGLEAVKGRRLVDKSELTPIIFVLNEDKAKIEKLKAEATKADVEGVVYFPYFKGLN